MRAASFSGHRPGDHHRDARRHRCGEHRACRTRSDRRGRRRVRNTALMFGTNAVQVAVAASPLNAEVPAPGPSSAVRDPLCVSLIAIGMPQMSLEALVTLMILAASEIAAQPGRATPKPR